MDDVGKRAVRSTSDMVGKRQHILRTVIYDTKASQSQIFQSFLLNFTANLESVLLQLHHGRFQSGILSYRPPTI